MIRSWCAGFGALSVLSFLSGPAASAQERRPVQIEDLFAVRSVGSPVVSPDGEWIAYALGRTSLDDERSYTRIYMVAADGGDPLALTLDGQSAGSP